MRLYYPHHFLLSISLGNEMDETIKKVLSYRFSPSLSLVKAKSTHAQSICWLRNTWHMQCECGIKMADSDSSWLSARRHTANIDICFGSNYFDIQINNWESIDFSWNCTKHTWFCIFVEGKRSAGKSHVGKGLTFRNLDITMAIMKGNVIACLAFLPKSTEKLEFFLWYQKRSCHICAWKEKF